MKKLLLFALAVLLFLPDAHAKLFTDVVEYRDGDAVLEGYIAHDEDLEGKLPGVLVFHEWKGLNDYAKKRANQLAEEGYVVFAADIYGKGVRPKNSAEAAKEAGKYKGDRARMRRRATAALDVLKQHPLVDPNRIGAIGYCFGGTVVLELARSGADVKAGVSFHGGLSSPNPLDAKEVKGELLVLHGAADPHVPEAEVSVFKEEMKDADVKMELVVYPGAVHGFTNPDNGTDVSTGVAYDEEADADSWQRMRVFFTRIFGG